MRKNEPVYFSGRFDTATILLSLKNTAFTIRPRSQVHKNVLPAVSEILMIYQVYTVRTQVRKKSGESVAKK